MVGELWSILWPLLLVVVLAALVMVFAWLVKEEWMR